MSDEWKEMAIKSFLPTFHMPLTRIQPGVRDDCTRVKAKARKDKPDTSTLGNKLLKSKLEYQCLSYTTPEQRRRAFGSRRELAHLMNSDFLVNVKSAADLDEAQYLLCRARLCYMTQHTPHYCDRVFVRSLSPFMQWSGCDYQSFPEIDMSDHTPVVALLQLKMIGMSDEKTRDEEVDPTRL